MKKSKTIVLMQFYLLISLLISMLSLTCRAADVDGKRNEGSGFDTPEEAILAFVEGLQKSNLDQMISTFAIESYCTHYDLAMQMQRLDSFQPSLLLMNGAISPMANDLMEQISVESRRASVVQTIKMALFNTAADHMSLNEDTTYRDIFESFFNGMPIYGPALGEDGTLSGLNEILAAIQNIPDFSGMNVSKPISMVCLSKLNDNYLSQPQLNAFFCQSLPIGADGITDCGIILENEEEAYLLTMSAVRYGDRWYNYDLGGNISSVLIANSNRRGFICADFDILYEEHGFGLIDALAALYDYIQNPDTDEASMLLDQFGKTEAEYDQEHQALLAQLRSGKDTEGNELDVSGIDFSKPLISQMPALKQASDDSGISFFDTDFSDIAIMSFDEMKTYFALD